MIKVLFGFLLVLSLAVPTGAVEIRAPEVPKTGLHSMPQETDSFGHGLMELLHTCRNLIHPELEEAARLSFQILVAMLLLSLLPVMAEKLNVSTL